MDRRVDPLEVRIIRGASTDQGTLGRLVIPSEDFETPVIELPWRDNRPNVSCIPEGKYEAFRRWSNLWRDYVYQLRGVPQRMAVQIHRGNLAGDTSKDFRTHSHGCILPGSSTGRLHGQLAVLASRSAVARFMARAQSRPLRIHITQGASHVRHF